jgi:hypothetical protein
MYSVSTMCGRGKSEGVALLEVDVKNGALGLALQPTNNYGASEPVLAVC